LADDDDDDSGGYGHKDSTSDDDDDDGEYASIISRFLNFSLSRVMFPTF